VAANLHHPLVVHVALQQLVAKAKERRIRDDIVFQYDGSICVLKHPCDTASRAVPAAEIHLRIVLEYLATPVDPIDYGAGRLTLLAITGLVRPRAISDDKKLGRLCQSDLGQDPFGQIRTIKDNQNNGGSHSGKIAFYFVPTIYPSNQGIVL
jgi:hypothetical protein